MYFIMFSKVSLDATFKGSRKWAFIIIIIFIIGFVLCKHKKICDVF